MSLNALASNTKAALVSAVNALNAAKAAMDAQAAICVQNSGSLDAQLLSAVSASIAVWIPQVIAAENAYSDASNQGVMT